MRNRQLLKCATCSVLAPPPIFFLSPRSLSQGSSLREWHHQGPAGAARRRCSILILGSRSESRGWRTHLLPGLGRRFGFYVNRIRIGGVVTPSVGYGFTTCTTCTAEIDYTVLDRFSETVFRTDLVNAYSLLWIIVSENLSVSHSRCL